jgi:hypothetical protein
MVRLIIFVVHVYLTLRDRDMQLDFFNISHWQSATVELCAARKRSVEQWRVCVVSTCGPVIIYLTWLSHVIFTAECSGVV